MRLKPEPATNTIAVKPDSNQARFAFTVLFIINTLNYADRYVLPAVLPKIQKDIGLTTIEEGLLGSSFLLIFAITTLPLGVWADRGVRKNIIGLCVGIWSIATVLTGITRNFIQMFVVRAVLGIGESGYGPASVSLIGDYFTKVQRGRILSYWSVGNLVGATAGFALGGLIADAFGWHWAFYMVGLPGLLAAYLAWRMFEPRRGVFDAEAEDIDKDIWIETVHGNWGSDFKQSAKKLFQIPTYWVLLGASTFSYFTLGGTSFWLPTYLVNTFSLTVGKAGIISGAILVSSGLIGTVIGGWLADYLQRYRLEGRLIVATFGFLIGAPLVLLTLLSQSLLPFIIMLVMAGIALSACTGPLFAVLQDVVIPAARATAFGLLSLIAHLLGDAAAPSVIGIIADKQSLVFALIVTTPTSLLLAGMACLFGLRNVARDIRRMQDQKGRSA